MRLLLPFIFCALPLLALAQEKIPEAALRQTYERCLPACEQTRSYAYCSNVCACVTNEMSRHWTAEEFRSKGASLSGSQGGSTPEAQVGRMAAACAERAQ
jgi:hypothetical protein